MGVLVIGFSGCASIVSGSTQRIKISGSPDNADVAIYDRQNEKIWNSPAPVSVKLNRGYGYLKGAEYRVEITKEGYEKQTIRILSSNNTLPYFCGNILLPTIGLIGIGIVDPMTGAMWTLKPENIHFDLRQSPSPVNGENVDDSVGKLPKIELGELVGIIGGFDGTDVIVNGKDTIGGQAPIGRALIVDADGEYIYLQSTFPMQTIVKCKVTSGDHAHIKKGMKVYLKP